MGDGRFDGSWTRCPLTSRGRRGPETFPARKSPSAGFGSIGLLVRLIRKGSQQPADDALRFYGHSHESLKVEDQVGRFVCPLMPLVGVVGDTGVRVGGDLEAVDGPLEDASQLWLRKE